MKKWDFSKVNIVNIKKFLKKHYISFFKEVPLLFCFKILDIFLETVIHIIHSLCVLNTDESEMP